MGIRELNNPAKILLLVRDGVATDVDSLCKAMGITPTSYTMKVILLGNLSNLREAGLITFKPDVRRLDRTSNPQVRLSDTWLHIQKALGLSLKKLAAVDLSRASFVEPFFGRPSSDSALDLFVLMPFDEKLRPVYEDHVKAVAKKLKLKVKRGDDFFTAHNVIQDIWNAIYGARIIIADCTGRNPNVFYEIGMAHTLGKAVILLTQSDEDVPFDLRQVRYIQYAYTPPGMREFEKKLAETIKSLL